MAKKVIEIFKIDSPVGTERVIIDYRETGEGVSSTLRLASSELPRPEFYTAMAAMRDDADQKRVQTLLFEAEEYVQGNRAQATLFDDGK